MELLSEGLERICLGDKTAALLVKPRLAEITGLLAGYINEIERFNPVYGLVKTDGSREMLIVKHILDSLAPLGHIARFLMFPGEIPALSGKKAADAGSGAGLPGIPLAICLPKVRFTLIERMKRRAGFLRNVLAVLGSGVSGGLSHVTVEETELEKVQGGFNLVTFRALSPLEPGFTASLLRLLPETGGIIAAYKGRHSTAEAELKNLATQGALAAQPYTTKLIPLAVPFLDEERCLAVIASRGEHRDGIEAVMS